MNINSKIDPKRSRGRRIFVNVNLNGYKRTSFAASEVINKYKLANKSDLNVH